ncbi:MAG: hypothetical protein ACPGU7_00340 [Gammaproteobacteria bacterium]
MPAAIALALAVILLPLAVPRLIAELHYARVHAVIEAVNQGRRLSRSQLLEVVHEQESALRFDPSERTHVRISRLYSALAWVRDLEPDERRAYRLRAMDHLNEALIRSPSDPDIWLRLAWLSLRVGDSDERILSYLRQATVLAPGAPDHVFPRLRLFIRMYDGGRGDSALFGSMFAAQLALAHRADSRRLRALMSGVMPDVELESYLRGGERFVASPSMTTARQADRSTPGDR